MADSGQDIGYLYSLAAAILVIILVGLNVGSHPVSALPTTSPPTTSPPTTSPPTTSPPTTSPPTTSPPQHSASTGGEATSAQAAQINRLLTASAATGNPLYTALLDVRYCSHISGAIATIRAVAQRYAEEYGLATRLETGQLPDGAALKNDLINAYYFSAVADYYFVEWAQSVQASDCISSTSAAAAYNDGAADTAKATRAGDAFVQLWNPIAKSQGFPERSGVDV